MQDGKGLGEYGEVVCKGRDRSGKSVKVLGESVKVVRKPVNVLGIQGEDTNKKEKAWGIAVRKNSGTGILKRTEKRERLRLSRSTV